MARLGYDWEGGVDGFIEVYLVISAKAISRLVDVLNDCF
jgi:hypothetical protein